MTMSTTYNDCLSTRIRCDDSTDHEDAIADAAPKMLEVLEAVYHQLVTDSDLDAVTVAAKYDALTKMVGQAIAEADPV
jgi:hypothetical protein